MLESLSAGIDRFLPDRSLDYRTRAWARSLIALSLASCPFWIVFCGIGLAFGMPRWSAVALVAFTLGHLSIPFLIRRTGALYWVMVIFGALCLAGVSLVASVVGGFPFQTLLWTMALPVAVASQRLYPSLLPLWASLCLAQYALWFAMAATGHAPAGVLTLTPTAAIALDACALVSWVLLMTLISGATARVTYEFAQARDAYQDAVLQSQKLDAVGKLAGGIENTFNNALMSMDYAAHLLEASVVDPEARDELEDLKATIQRSKALSRKLERLGRDENEVLELIAADRAIAALEKTLQRLAIYPVVVRLDLGAPGAYVRCDANQLDQVLVNLVVNARDAMPNGGRISIDTRVIGDRFVVEVADCGTGIPPDVLPHIFEPFFTTKPRESGTGLGLWVCRSIAEMRGGTLTATSTVGVGTVMRFELPLADPDATDTAPVRRSAATSASRSGPMRIRDTPADVPLWRSKLGWFSYGLAGQRGRVWGSVIAAIAFATVPFWLAFAIAHWVYFGLNEMAAYLFAGAALSAAAPFGMRATRSLRFGAVALGATAFVALSALAISRGGFQIQILVWIALLPIAAAHQQELRHLTRQFTASVVALYAIIFALAISGVTTPVAMPASHQLLERAVVLVALLGLLLLTFRVASAATERFATERDNYEAALARSQDTEMLGTFAGSIAHDLNNVLTTLQYSTVLLARRIPTTSPSQEDVAELRNGGARIRELARQLTRFGRSSGGDEAYAVPAVAISTLQPLLTPIVGSDVEIIATLDSGAAAIPLKVNALDQLVINLALNARDAMPEGGRLSIATRATDAAVEITVSDTGRGIPARILDRVCEPFFTTDEDRVGLGLWVCREVTSEARGTLTVESTEGAGTTVRLVFPRVSHATIARGSRPFQAAIGPAPRTSPETSNATRPEATRPRSETKEIQ